MVQGKAAAAPVKVVAKPSRPPRQCLLVLGMHRSGTSALSGLLAALGAQRAREELPPNFANEKGYFEPAATVALNDRLLVAAGSRWSDWDAIPPAFFAGAEAMAVRAALAVSLRRDFPGTRSFVLKDPRICRLLDLWLPLLVELRTQPVAIHVFRPPLEVARSLHTRDGLSMSHGLLLWLRHVLDAERGSRKLKRRFVTYSGLLRDWQRELSPTLAMLNLPKRTRKGDADSALDPAMRHHLQENEAPLVLHRWFETTFEALTILRRKPGDAATQKTLDRVRVDFNRACSAFSPALHHALGERVDRPSEPGATS